VGSGRTYTECGTADYQAPEIVNRSGTTRAADYWALGVLVYEMLLGRTPFMSYFPNPREAHEDTQRKIRSGRFYVPNTVSPAARALITALLRMRPEERLGCGPGGPEEVMTHEWFAGFDWAGLQARRLPAPYRPPLASPSDASNFSGDFEAAEARLAAAAAAPITTKATWGDWDRVTDI
jgi:serine/threonine protein kinase